MMKKKVVLVASMLFLLAIIQTTAGQAPDSGSYLNLASGSISIGNNSYVLSYVLGEPVAINSYSNGTENKLLVSSGMELYSFGGNHAEFVPELIGNYTVSLLADGAPVSTANFSVYLNESKAVSFAKSRYTVGDRVAMYVRAQENDTVAVRAPSAESSFPGGSYDAQLEVQEVGEYAVEVRRSGSTVFSGGFEAFPHANYTENFLIYSGKEAYAVGEEAVIYLNYTKRDSQIFYISSGESIYRFLGIAQDSVKFSPNAAGMYTAKVEEGGQVLASYSFRVVERKDGEAFYLERDSFGYAEAVAFYFNFDADSLTITAPGAAYSFPSPGRELIFYPNQSGTYGATAYYGNETYSVQFMVAGQQQADYTFYLDENVTINFDIENAVRDRRTIFDILFGTSPVDAITFYVDGFGGDERFNLTGKQLSKYLFEIKIRVNTGIPEGTYRLVSEMTIDGNKLYNSRLFGWKGRQDNLANATLPAEPAELSGIEKILQKVNYSYRLDESPEISIDFTYEIDAQRDIIALALRQTAVEEMVIFVKGHEQDEKFNLSLEHIAYDSFNVTIKPNPSIAADVYVLTAVAKASGKEYRKRILFNWGIGDYSIFIQRYNNASNGKIPAAEMPPNETHYNGTFYNETIFNQTTPNETAKPENGTTIKNATQPITNATINETKTIINQTYFNQTASNQSAIINETALNETISNQTSFNRTTLNQTETTLNQTETTLNQTIQKETIALNKSYFYFRDSLGRRQDFEFRILGRQASENIGISSFRGGNVLLLNETHNIEIIPANSTISRIILFGINLSERPELGIEALSAVDAPHALLQKKAYAVDPSRLIFSSLTLSSVAEASSLYKCALWNFSMQLCAGEWAKIMDLATGTEYNLTIGKNDPAFIEADIAEQPELLIYREQNSRANTEEFTDVALVVINKGGKAENVTIADTFDGEWEIGSHSGSAIISSSGINFTLGSIESGSITELNYTISPLLDGAYSFRAEAFGIAGKIAESGHANVTVDDKEAAFLISKAVTINNHNFGREFSDLIEYNVSFEIVNGMKKDVISYPTYFRWVLDGSWETEASGIIGTCSGKNVRQESGKKIVECSWQPFRKGDEKTVSVIVKNGNPGLLDVSAINITYDPPAGLEGIVLTERKDDPSLGVDLNATPFGEDLIVRLRHNSTGIEDVLIRGDVKFTIDKLEAAGGEGVTFAIYNYSSQYFTLHIGDREVIPFGRSTLFDFSEEKKESVIVTGMAIAASETKQAVKEFYGSIAGFFKSAFSWFRPSVTGQAIGSVAGNQAESLGQNEEGLLERLPIGEGAPISSLDVPESQPQAPQASLPSPAPAPELQQAQNDFETPTSRTIRFFLPSRRTTGDKPAPVPQQKKLWFTTSRAFVIETKNLSLSPFITSKIERAVSCDRCSGNFVPAGTDVGMSLRAYNFKATENATLIDYFPIGWNLTDAGSGIASAYNSTHNKIEWEFVLISRESNVNYSLKSPPENSNETEIVFYSEFKINNTAAATNSFMPRIYSFRLNLRDSKSGSVGFTEDKLEIISGDGSRSIINLDLTVDGKHVRSIRINELNVVSGGTYNLSIEDASSEISSPAGISWTKAYSIDPTGLNFSNATVTSVAKGTALYKCRDWDFAAQACFGSWSKVMDLVPGQEYSFILTPEDPGYAETGLASINTNKSIYHPGEAARIIMVVLDTGGRLVSDAAVELNITAPDASLAEFSTALGTIIEEERGIYTSVFTDTLLEGNYSMAVHAAAPEVDNSMVSYFTVSVSYDFDILRNTPVTTDPFKGPFTSSVKIASLAGIEPFDFTEVLPINFTVVDAGGGVQSSAGNKVYLTWSGLSSGSEVSYIALPPLITPELWEIGPSKVSYSGGQFDEARPWFLAVDPLAGQNAGFYIVHSMSEIADAAVGTYTNIATVSGSSLAANTDYFLYASFGLASSESDINCEFRVTGDGGTLMAGQVEPPGSDYDVKPMVWTQAYTTDSSPANVVMEFDMTNTQGGGNPDSCFSKNSQLILIDLSQLTEGGDYYNASFSGDTALSTTPTNYATVTLDEADGSKDWLVFVSALDQIDAEDTSFMMSIYDGAADYMQMSVEGESNDDNPISAYTILRSFDNAALNTPFSLRSWVETNSDHDLLQGSVFAINLGVFESYTTLYETAKAIPGALGMIASINHTPARAGNTVVFANYIADTNDAASGWEDDITIDGTINPVGWDWTAGNIVRKTPHDATDLHTNLIVSNISIAADGSNITLRSADLTSNLGNADELSIVAFSQKFIDLVSPGINASANNSAPKVNEDVNITANISDAGGLGTCQFFMNGTSGGSFIILNKSASGTNDQCSQNFTIGLIRGNVINFTVIVNDTSINTAGGNANRSQQIITVANTLPIFPHGTSINNSNPLEDREVRIGANATEPADNDAISMVIFSWNGSTGAWVNLSNSSVVNLMSINYTVEATIGIEAGNVVGYVFYANDSGGGFGSSGISTFDVAFISPPNISSVGCDDGGGYEACSGIGYGDTLTSVRARCNTTSGGIIRNITFILTNIQDNNQFFNVNVSNSYNTYYNYSPNLIIDDSGDFNLKVLCYENPVSENDTNWSISFGTLSAQLVSPAFNANVTKNRFFNFTAQVSCSGGECGFVNATLDPPGDYNETIAFEGFESADFGIFGTTSGAVVLADAGGGINPICGAGEQQGSLPNVQSGSYAIEFASASACPTGGQIEAEINATNFTNIAVNFSWSASDTEPPDAVTFWASINNSGTYEQIWSIIPRSNGPVTLPYNSTDTHFVLDDVMSQSPSTAHSLRLKFNFTVFTGTSSDEFYIDNFNVSGLRISGSSSSSAKGAVSTTEGDTPFYTIMQNPMTASTRSCLANMSAGDICNVTWIVNSTGSAGTTWEFFAYFNSSNQTIPGIGAESGALTGTYTASGGTFSNATANDTSYWFVGESGTGTTVTAFAEMTYQLNRIPPESINNLSLDLVYCHSGDVFPDVGCNGVPVSGLVNFDGDQNVSIFDFSSGKWALIGLLDTTSGGNEIKGTFSSSSVFSNYVNASSNEVKLKVTAYFTTVIPGDNAFLVIDMANLTVGVKGYNLSAETSKVNLTIVDNTAPAAEYANIYPTVTATDGESLKCSFYIYDALSDQVTANVSWYNGDALGYSEVVSVDKFVEVNRTLSPANTTDGELWKCGVTPSDWDLTGMQVNSSAVLVVSSQPPAVNSVQCSENGIAFGSCSGITFGDTLAAARATCEDSDGYPTNITFNVTNLEDAKSFASGNATLNASGGVFTFDFADFTVQDSGTFNVTALCIDNNATQGRNHSSWSIPWGTLSASLIRPASNKNVTQLVFFNFTSTVTCSGGECGFVNATIDPETAADLEDPFESVEIGAINLNNPPPLEIMNKKEFIKDNEIWSVDFKTEGTSDLLITSPNARWTEILSDNLSTHNEMKFLELACGSTNLNNGIKIIDSENQVYYYNKIKNNDSIKIQKLLYENYNCEDTGHIRNKVIVPGYATLQLEFAGVTDFAEDPANNVNISQPDAAAPGMNVVVQFVGDDFDASDTITVNTSDITVGPKRIYSTSGTVVVNNGRVMSVPFFISSDAPDQVVGISIAGTLIGHTFRVITPAEGSGNFTGQSGSAVIGDGTDGTRTAGGTIVLDSLIIPSGLTVTVDTTDRDSTTPGNQGYLPAIILVDGPVSIAGTLNVSGTAGSAASDTTDVGGAGGAGGPGGAGGGGGGSDANSGAIGGSGFTGGGGGGSDDGGSTSGDGGSGTGSAGNTSTASNGGIGGSAINANLTGGTGGRGNNQEGAGGGGGTGSFFGTSGTGGTVTANGAGQFGGGGGAQANVNNQEGGGGGFATAGGDAEATGGAAHGNVQLIPIAGGSGGGGGGSIEDNNGDDGGGGGGGGGGAILVYSNEYILVSNSISSIGGEGGNDAPTGDALGGAGGGGSGGAIILQSGNVTVTGSLDTSGGAGGDAAGDGGLGRARIDGLRSSDFGTGVSASNFTGPAITSVTSSQVIGKANASSIIEVWVIYGSSQSTFKGTANSSGDFRIDVSYYSGGLNYIAAFQNMSSGQLSVSGSASLSSFLPPKGVIPEGSGRPFYTISANPMIHLNRSCLANMISGQSCNTTWIVNSTGDIDFTYEFFVTYKSTNYSSNVADTNTSFVNLTIINNTAPRVISVSISPAIPATSNDLTCTFNVSDTYSDTSLTANITWYNGGMLNYSIILPVPNGEFYSHTLGSDNTSDGELWKCGVIPFDHATRGSQKNSSTVLILGTLPTITYGLQCQEDGTTWGSCASLAFNDNFTAVRVNCTDPDGFILNATFNFTNVEDGKLFFKANATFNSTDTFLYNLNDIRIRDSGRFNVTATCIDNNNTKTTNRTSWSIAWGTLATSLVAPSSAVNVTRYQFFNFTAQLSCSGGECGFVNATLDPTVIHNETIVFESFESGTGGIFNTTKYPPVGAVALADASGGVASICAAQQGTLPNVLAGSYAIEISAGTDCGTFGQIQAEINATNYTDIRLNFSWSAADMESPNDQATLWVLINNSGSWQSIWSVIPNSNGATLSYSNVSLVLDDVMSNSPSTAHSLRFKFNFTSSSGGSTDEFYVDSFNVSGQRAEVSKGIVSTVEGEVPFFTISANPYSHLSKSCLADMGSGYACNVTWEVNATGGADTKWEFFVIGDAVNYSSYVSQDNSTSVNITIILNEPPSVSSVTLTPLQPSNATDLNCSFIVTDPNTFDTLTANVTWYKGGVFNNSRTLSVSNGAQSNSSLSFSQTNPGEQWKCGVIPFDEVEYGDQVNSSSVTILLNTPPVINSVQCEENGTTWESCRSILYTDRITRVRINCTSEVAMSNATFTLTNLPDGRVYFSNITIDRSADFFIFNNDDVKINDSGDFLLNASCTDESNITSANSSRWLVPWGTLSVSLVEPASDTTVQFNDFFTFTSRVSCVGGECGSINASIWRNSSFDFGFGESGALSVTSGNRVVNNYTFLILNTTAGSKHINVSNTTEFRAGDEILIVQMQNGTQGIAGKYEFNIISQASKNAINLTYGLSSSYFTSLFNTSNATAAQIVKVPHFTNVTVNSGASITAEPWNGQKGGIIIFRATGIVTVLGHINATAKGFRGGLGELGNGGLNGESFDGYVGSGGTDTASGTGGGNPGTDGGGGSSNYNAVSPSGTRGGGGGGGHVDGNANNDGSGGGAGGGYGGGGGGGGGGGDNNAGGSGGSGGSTGTGAGGGGTGTDGGAGASGGNAGNAGGGAVGGAAGSGSSTGQGGGSGSATANGIGAGGAGGGGIYGKSNLATLLPGSGGGAGGSHDNGPLRGQDGGAGGGIISIVAKKVVVTGTIQSNGQNGNATVNRRGASGAGAGGSVYLKAENLSIGTNLVSVTGGTGGAAGTQGGGGGSGGVGRIKLDYSSVSGSSNPAAGATGGTDAGLFVLVSTIGGDTPFYTTDKNPKGFLNQSCLKNLTSGNSCDVIWNINATGEIGSKWKFITKFNATTYPYNVTSKQTSSIVLTIQDATQVPPIVTLISPSTGHITNSPLLLFNCSATDNTQLKNMTLFGNFDGAFAENGTNLIGGVSNNTNFSRTLGEGQFIWNCRAYDTDNNVDWGNSNFTLTVDLTKPSFNISHPANNSNFTVGDIDFNFTVFDNFDALMLCNLTVNGTIYHQNFNANNGTLSSKQVTGLAQGIYVWNLTCVDDAGNVNTTALRRFNVIDLAPNTTLNAPSNNTMINSSTVVFLHTPTDNNNVTFARLILDGVLNQTNNSVTKDAINAFTVRNFNEGRHNWTVNVSDQTGLSYAAPLLFFTIDYKAPSINLTGPDDNYGFNTSSITLNFTVGDTVDSTLLCNLTINGSVADPLISANTGQIISRGLSNRPDGHFVWNVTCWDDANNTNTSASRHFNVSAKPSVSLSSPGANAVVGSPNISFLYTPTDNTNFSKCEFMFNGKLNHTNTTIFNSEVNNFTLYNLASGVYNWTVNCTDTIGLTALAATRNFTIDVVPPNITLKKPLQNATLYGTEVMFNFSASDDIDKFMLCNLTLNGQVNVSNINVPNATYANTTVVILTDGDYFWNITCIDDALNSNTSETRNFTMSVPPDVTLSSPESGTIINYTFNVSFAFLAFDSDGVPNATFILNGKANQTLFNIDTGDFNYFRINFTADGAYTWQVNATDPNGLVGTSSIRSFIIDTTPPNVTLNIPANNSVVTSNNVTFNFTASDFLDQIFLCNITIDGEVRFGDISVTNNSDTLRNFSLQDGEHNWSVLCIDNANNTNLIELHNFSVEAPPFVVLQYPADGSRSSSRNQSLNYTPYDIFGFSSCALLLNGALNQTDTSITADEMNAFAVENLTHGKYNWTSRCTDAAPDFNIYTPSNYTFYIDLLGPGIVLNYPADGQTLNTNDILFNFTPTDQFGFNTVLTCNITLDGVTNVSLINVTSGNYNETLVTNLADGSHTWNVTCKDDLNNTNTSLSATFIINQPDLYINDSLVIVNNSQPREGDNVTINATIFNIGGIPATNVLVRFYDRNPNAGGEQIDGDRTIPSIDITKNVTVNVTWKAQIGDYEIFVIVDPLKAVSELNETNNNASRNVSISMWHIINGNLTGNLVIQSLGNSTVFLWDTTDGTAGNVFVIDTDSSIIWANLTAIGRNTTGGNASNDWGEIDSALQTSNYSDSVNRTFLAGEVPLNLTTFIIYTYTIENVSVANSTNNSVFTTGVMWDRTDDAAGAGHGEYNGTEDIVFATAIKRNQLGKYGNYDFEMRVPSALKSYKQPQSSVTFFVELR